jgi:hypothetical protein
MKIYSTLLALCLAFLFPQDGDAILGLIACPSLTKYLNIYLDASNACRCRTAWSWSRGIGVRAICEDRDCASISCNVDKIDLAVYFFGAQTEICSTQEPFGPTGGSKNGPLCTVFKFGKDGLFQWADANKCESTDEGDACGSCTLIDKGTFPLPYPGSYQSGCV